MGELVSCKRLKHFIHLKTNCILISNVVCPRFLCREEIIAMAMNVVNKKMFSVRNGNVHCIKKQNLRQYSVFCIYNLI